MVANIFSVQNTAKYIIVLFDTNEEFVLNKENMYAYMNFDESIDIDEDLKWDKNSIWWNRNLDLNKEEIINTGIKIDKYMMGEQMRKLIGFFYGIEASFSEEDTKKYKTPVMFFNYEDKELVSDIDGNVVIQPDGNDVDTKFFVETIKDWIDEHSDQIQSGFNGTKFYDGFKVKNNQGF